jgi:hypothetical protein
MTTIGDYIQRVQSLYSKGVQSNSTRLSAKHIYHKLMTVRETLYSRFINKNSSINSEDRIVIECIPLKPVSFLESGCFTGCNIKRTVYTVPSIINDKTIVVLSGDGSKFYTRTTWEESKNLSGAKYTSKEYYFYIKNGYIYILNSKAKSITVSAIWKDIIEVHKFKVSIGKDNCIGYKEVEFSLNSEFSDAIIEMASKELIDTFNRFGREDISNNSIDTPANEAK